MSQRTCTLRARAEIALAALLLPVSLATCGTPSDSAALAFATPHPSVAASPMSTMPLATPPPTEEPTPGPSAGRPPLDVFSGDRELFVTGGLRRDGSYRVAAGRGDEWSEVGSIPDIEERVPDPWTLLTGALTGPQLSDSGFLVLPLASGPKGDERMAVGIFDVLAPDGDPLVIPAGGGFRVAGDRLWVRAGETAFAVYDLPSATPTSLTLAPGASVPAGRSVPFYLSAAGDAVLIRVSGEAGAALLVGVTGAERPVLAVPVSGYRESWLAPTGIELPFGPDGASLLAGACAASSSSTADFCVVHASGRQTAYDVPGRLIDVAWDPGDAGENGEGIPLWVSTKGVGLVRDRAVRMIVRLGDWQPARIAGVWSNALVLASGEEPRLAFALTGADAITKLPMPPDSVVALQGSALLRVAEMEDQAD